MAIIYLITNAENGKRYVGKTKRTLKRRLVEHFMTANKGSQTILSCAIRKYGKAAFSAAVLSEVSLEDLDSAEIQFIASLKPEYNMTSGGDGGTMSQEARDKISKALSGKTKSSTHRENIAAALKQHTRTPEHQAKITQKLIGYKHSESMKAKISVIHKGRQRSPEAVAKTAAAHRGMKRSEETKQKLREAWMRRRVEKNLG